VVTNCHLPRANLIWCSNHLTRDRYGRELNLPDAQLQAATGIRCEITPPAEAGECQTGQPLSGFVTDGPKNS
jgi:hypothetical protein